MKVKKQGLPNISGFFFRIGWLCLSYSPAGKEMMCRPAATTSSRTNRKWLKRPKSSSTGRNSLAFLIIMGLRLHICDYES